MATPNREHAVVTASAFERWSHCTAAPRYEEQFPDGSSVYAEEGTLAHAVCELYGRKKFTIMTKRKFNAELKKLQAHELWQDEMLKTAEFYVNYLEERAFEYDHLPQVFFEVRVDLSAYIPEGFGTCDCAMIGGDTLRITDYKHGKGVPVSSIDNGQMRLYALGALKLFYPLFGDSIKRVCTAIVQPRITEDVTEEYLTVEELRAWGETVKPKAQAAFFGTGVFNAGEWCQFCKGRAECRARAEYYAGFTQFVGADLEGRMTAGDAIEREKIEDFYGASLPPVLTDDEVGELLFKATGLVAWYNDLQDYARDAILSGRTIPGWKVVEGRSIRAFKDADAAMERMRGEGFEDAILYDRKPKSLAELEKLTGKARFSELMGDLITRPPGKPTLALFTDKREAYTGTGSNEFSGITDG